MRKFILPMLCLLLIFGCSITLGGCAPPEETGAGDWLKWYFNQDSGLPVYEGTVAIDGLDSPVEIYLTIMLLLISLPTARPTSCLHRAISMPWSASFRWI